MSGPVTLVRRAVRTVARAARRHPRRSLALLVVAAAVTAGATFALRGAEPPPPTAGPSFTYRTTWTLLELQRHVEAGEVAAITATEATEESPGNLVAKTRDGQLVGIVLTVDPGAAASALSGLGYGDLLTTEAWASVRAAARPAAADPLRSSLVWIVPIGLIIFLVLFLRWMLARSANRGRTAAFTTILPAASGSRGDGRSGGHGLAAASLHVRLADVAGCEEAKLELTETIEFLRSPDRFRRLGAKIPRGVLLYGPPGTGKTLLAKAVAAEAGVPFIAASASEFVEKYVGVGAGRVRQLFTQAREHGRAVVFIDEFDALAKARGGVNSHEEREQTLNQLLVELDGFSPNEEIVVLAATNRVDTLDAAVVRPGRFNRKIHVGLPDVAGREAILAVHALGKPLAPAVDLGTVARKTYGFSGAQLADLLNEAAILAARRGGEAVDTEDIHAGWLKVAVGTSRRRSMDERERSIIAAHEVGHAICGRMHGDRRKVEEISLFAHGEALGVTVSSQEDNDLPAESDLRSRLIALMGGRAAEELLFQEVTGGAANDFEQANRIATAMVTRWGMGRDPESPEAGPSGRGALSFLVARQGGALPADVQAAATRAIRAILDDAYTDACGTLMEHMELLRRLAAYLVEHERVDGETFEAVIDGRIDVPNAHDEWRPERARPRAWAEIPEYHGRRGTQRPTLVPSAAATPAGAPPPPSAPQDPRVAAAAPMHAGPAAGTSEAAPAASVRQVARPVLARRIRRLAAGYLAQAQARLRDGEEHSEAPLDR